MRPCPPPRCLLLVLLCAGLSPACQVTWRQPEIKPLNPVRQYAVPADALCDALIATLEGLELDATAITREAEACLVETDYRRLEGNERWEQLREVAFLTGPDFFSHGRYLVTASVRQLAADSRIRLTTRIEGFDAGYRVLRSTGLIEETIFARIGEALGVRPRTSG